jgi:hypothetical protein
MIDKPVERRFSHLRGRIFGLATRHKGFKMYFVIPITLQNYLSVHGRHYPIQQFACVEPDRN